MTEPRYAPGWPGTPPRWTTSAKTGLGTSLRAGAAMPLVWAHAEHLKLLRSLNDGRVYDMPPQTHQRYIVERRRSPHAFWRFNHKRRTIAEGRRLRIETHAPALVHWSLDEWRTTHDTDARVLSASVPRCDVIAHRA